MLILNAQDYLPSTLSCNILAYTCVFWAINLSPYGQAPFLASSLQAISLVRLQLGSTNVISTLLCALGVPLFISNDALPIL
jgi:hypothetical protein